MPHGNPVLQFLGILILTTHKVNPKGPIWSTHSLTNSNSFSLTMGTGVYNSFLDFTPSVFCISLLLAMLQLGEWVRWPCVCVGWKVGQHVHKSHAISCHIWANLSTKSKLHVMVMWLLAVHPGISHVINWVYCRPRNSMGCTCESNFIWLS